MSWEVELKLALGNDGPAWLRSHSSLQQLPSTHTTLANTYYDTPDEALEKACIALRIRHTPTRILQTLKTAGHTAAGLSRRGEWEWQIGGDLDVAGLVDLPPMQTLDSAIFDALEPRFSTHFERQIWYIERGEARIELALDQGEIRSGSRRVAINEIELELKPSGRRSGDPATLWQLALELAKHVPLRPANASKAARGAALLRQCWPVGADTEGKRTDSAQARFDQAIDALDAWVDSGDKRFRTLANDALEAIAIDALQSAEIREHAHALAVSLTAPDWLTRSFGHHSLALQIALQTT